MDTRVDMAIQLSTALDDTHRQLNLLTQTAAKAISEALPGCLFENNRCASALGDLFYFSVLLRHWPEGIAFELPIELAVSEDIEPIRQFIQTDPETVDWVKRYNTEV